MPHAPCSGHAASGDRLLVRWFDEDRRGFAFGCVFATGEFGGSLAFYLGWYLTRDDPSGYKTVYLIGGVHSECMPAGGLLPCDGCV